MFPQTVKNSPVQVFSVNGASQLQVNDVTINNKDGDANGGHNTDAFDVGSSDGITISGATVYNQDDCLAVNSGTDITFTGGYCSGGHGLSIGSVGGRDDNTVDGVKILDSKIVDSDNGVRIKTVSGATGKVNNVSYKGITLSNVSPSSVSQIPKPHADSIAIDRQVRHRHPAGLRERLSHRRAHHRRPHHRPGHREGHRLCLLQGRPRLHPLWQGLLLQLDLVWRQPYRRQEEHRVPKRPQPGFLLDYLRSEARS